MVIRGMAHGELGIVSGKRKKLEMYNAGRENKSTRRCSSEKHTFAERLYTLGTVKPLTTGGIGVSLYEKGRGFGIHFRRIWPLFYEVGVVVKGYNGGRR